MAKRALGGCGLGCVSTEYVAGTASQPVCVATDAHGRMHVAGDRSVFVKLASGRSAEVAVGPMVEQVASMVFGGDNDMILVDHEANCVYRVPGAGPTERVAGDPDGRSGFANAAGTQALFDGPNGVIYLAGRGLYLVADGNNNCIRAIARHTWEVTTCCGEAMLAGKADGTGQLASFHAPRGLALLDRDTFVVADYMNDAIRMVHLDALDQAHVTTIPCKVASPLAVAVDGAGKIVVVCDGVHHVMAVYKTPDDNRWIAESIAGSASVAGFRDGPCLSALFNSPFSVSMDARGRVLLCERRANSFRTPSNTLVRVLECGLAPPLQLAYVSRDGHAEARRHRVEMLDRGLFADVSILLQDGSCAGAHSSILYPHSVFFRQRLGGMARNKCAPTYTIDLSTFRLHPAQLRVLLYFIYTQQLPNMMGGCSDAFVTPLEMCRVADMMLEERMHVLCLEQMALSLNALNVNEIATEAYALGLRGPIQEIAAFWVRNPSLVSSVIASMDSHPGEASL